MKINVLGLLYTVEEVEHIPETVDTIGLCLLQEQRILIKKDLPKELKSQTLLHELIHAIFQGLGEYELVNNEKLVQSLATGLNQLLLDNELTSFY